MKHLNLLSVISYAVFDGKCANQENTLRMRDPKWGSGLPTQLIWEIGETHDHHASYSVLWGQPHRRLHVPGERPVPSLLHQAAATTGGPLPGLCRGSHGGSVGGGCRALHDSATG